MFALYIHGQLYKWRQEIVKEGYASNTKALGMKAMAWTLSSPVNFTNAGKAGRWFLHNIPFVVNNRFNPWYKQRDMPEEAKESFAAWYAKNEKKK
jgi:L-lactate dehydrogenase complex protein LldF